MDDEELRVERWRLACLLMLTRDDPMPALERERAWLIAMGARIPSSAVPLPSSAEKDDIDGDDQ